MVSLKPSSGILSVKTQFGGQNNFISLNAKRRIVVIIVGITEAAAIFPGKLIVIVGGLLFISLKMLGTEREAMSLQWPSVRFLRCHTKVPPAGDFEQHARIPLQL